MKEIHVDLGEGVEGGSQLYVPHRPVFNEDVETVEPAKDFGVVPWERPKVCPSCKAKFAHSMALAMCTKCKIPDEVLQMGTPAIARWKRQQGAPKHKPRFATKTKKTVKHGRKGVKR